MRSYMIALRMALMLTVVASCKGHPPPQDTDKELFRTEGELTVARELNLAKWSGDYFRVNGRLPEDPRELAKGPPPSDPKEDPLNDAWGRPIQLIPMGKGLEVRSLGPDGQANTEDDVVHHVEDVSTVQ
jgi:hypothetical protein